MSKVALKVQTIRWDQHTDALIKEAAKACGGIPISQFVREAASMRAVIVLSEAGPSDLTRQAQLMRSLSAQLREE